MDNLNKLLYWRGIANEYFNYRGEKVAVSEENRLRLLQAMEVDTGSAEAVDAQVYELDIQPWQEWLPAMLVVDEGAQVHFSINLPPEVLADNFQFEIITEDGSRVGGCFIPAQAPEIGDYLHEGIRYSRRSVQIAPIPCGYHQLKVWREGMEDQFKHSQLVVVPEKAYTPDWVEQNQSPWGIIVQLYTLRSGRNWGIGDFTDLMNLIENSANSGADMIGLNPLHSLRFPIDQHCSPYSPSDRRFINPLYIDPEIEPDFTQDAEEISHLLEGLRKPEMVDYSRVYAVKMLAFHKMYKHFVSVDLEQETERGKSFKAFLASADDSLRQYCLFEALQRQDEYHFEELSAQQIIHLCEENHTEIHFYAYLEWIANKQLKTCQARALELGMKVGLMRDLAVGADGGGSEVSMNLDLFCRDASVGAPPDPLAELGQNWGLPPIDPFALKNTNFRHFVQLLRSNMSSCGALRIDHAMSLMRLWWCPPGRTADFGSYVFYPFKEMLGLLKLESVRHKCMVIGEDMGVVPDEFRNAIIGANIFTNKMFYFEKVHEHDFRPPAEYFPRSLAMLTNHDVPTIASWWVGSDLQLRQSLELFEEGVSFDDVVNHREFEKRKLLEWLQSLGLIEGQDFDNLLTGKMSRDLVSSILHGVSQCASQLFVVQLEDLELLEEPVNVPGTSDQYPNWRRKLGVPLESIFDDQLVLNLLKTIDIHRKQLQRT